MDLTAVTLTELRYVVAIAETGHFGRAAAHCHVTQPTLSAQVRKLEDNLGVRLFERGKRVRPTPAGERVVERARAMLAELEALGDVARGHAEPLVGPLRLGIIPTLGPYLLPWLLPRLADAFPKLRPVVREGLTATLVDDLLAHRLDAGLLALPLEAPGIVATPLFREPFWAALPPGHALAGRRRVREADLAGSRLLLLDEGHCLRDQALAVCGDADGRRDGDDFRATSLETLRHLVAADLGVTLLPALALRAHDGTVTRPLAGAHAGRTIGLAWRRSFPRADALDALATFVRTTPPPGVRAIRV
ncbi:MAG: LysR family transcriptional regulator [bacterium]|nr:LysR family transcriptional regulator [bacterium]